MTQKEKRKKRKIRYFNKPVKIGAAFMGVGASVEFGGASLYEYIQDERMIFVLETLRILSYIIGVIFASGGVIKQANEDYKSIKIGEKVKKEAEDFESNEDTKEDFSDKIIDFTKTIFKNRFKK